MKIPAHKILIPYERVKMVMNWLQRDGKEDSAEYRELYQTVIDLGAILYGLDIEFEETKKEAA